MGPTEYQVASFLFSSLLASEALLLSAFGNIYSLYVKSIGDEMFSVSNTLRALCYVLTFIMIVVSASAISVIDYLSGQMLGVLGKVVYALYGIVILIVIPPIVICWRMYQDVRA